MKTRIDFKIKPAPLNIIKEGVQGMFLKMQSLLLHAMILCILVSCGGSEGFTTPPAESGGGTTPTDTDVATVTLLSSSPQLLSGDASGITITAIVKDTNNNLLIDKTVSFATDSGALEVTQATTDASGIATATLTSGGDESNRTIALTATTGTVSATTSISVTGTTLTVSGQNSLVLGDSTVLTLTLNDSFGAGQSGASLTVSSAQGNTLSAATLTTDTSGGASVTITGDSSGTDTISVAGLGTTATFSLAVSGDNFQFITPSTAGAEVNLGANQAITVRWLQNGTAVAGQTVNFSATRGTLSAASDVTDASGDASVTIASTNAGPSVVNAAVSGGPSASREIEFVATTASTIDVQTSLSTVGPSGDQATITATVRDANGNLVKNKQINFSLTDITGGSISAATGTTDSNGQASTVYASAQATSAKDGVSITATVADTPAVTNTVTLTVGQRALFVTLGTGNSIEEPDTVTYRDPYAVYVTDAAGGAVANANISLSIIPTRYFKGTYVWNGTAYVPNYTVANGCTNEDIDENGQFTAAEDSNTNGTLEPGNVVTVDQSTVTTGSDGFATFKVAYAQQYANWIEVRLEARVSVGGTESLDTAIFTLPVLAADVTEEGVAPPGSPSPYGTAATCADPS